MTTIVDQIQDVYRIPVAEWAFADCHCWEDRASGVPVGPEARFFKLILASGAVKPIHCNHCRITPGGVLALADYLPDEPEFTFRVTQIYAANAWLSLEEDKDQEKMWNEECQQRIAVDSADYEKQLFKIQGGRLS